MLQPRGMAGIAGTEAARLVAGRLWNVWKMDRLPPEERLMPEYWTPLMIAKRYSVTSETVRQWIHRGRIRAVNVGTDQVPRYRIPESEVQKLEKPVKKRI